MEAAYPAGTCEWDTSGVERSIQISGDMIRLGQLLKLSGAVPDGAQAKAAIAAGQVDVNGETELRRGRQLHAGDVVRIGAEALRIVTGQ